ncbi:MAG: phosphatase PAP2 family protein [Pseudomonadales bacterium]|nr:phosphatase PAP2 family protein [Pseudomonadales bacterium]
MCQMWLGFLALIFCMNASGIDFFIADQIFTFGHQHWVLRDNFVTSLIIHTWGRRLSEGLAMLVLGAMIFTWFNHHYQAWRKPLIYLFSAITLSTVLVSVLKHLIAMDCPWNLAHFGGTLPYIGLLQHRPAALPHSACFPAGHASAGYAWVALYFFFDAIRPQWRRLGLLLGLVGGLVFGVGQQLRGAHFLSHDLWTLMICWTVSWLLAVYIFRLPDDRHIDLRQLG